MADSVANTSFLSILRRSKFASFSPNIGQVYTSPIQSANRGDWGIKASVFAHGGGGARSQIRNLAIPEIDSVLGLPVWKSAEKTARFIRQWGGEGIVARVEPQAGVHSWSTSDGAVMDPWGAQAGRITQANKAIDRLHSDKYYNQFIATKYTDLTQHHYLLHDFFFDRLIKSKFIDASTIHTHELPPLTSPVNLASPEDRIDVSELGEEEHLQAYYYLRSSNAAIAAEWATFAESALDPHSLELARRHLKTKAVVLNEWARIAAELQHMRQPYSHWEEAAANVVEQAGDANELARAQAKAVFAAQPAMVAQLRTAEGREKAEAQWKVEWESLKALAEKRGLSISEWRKGNDAWDFDLRNIRAIKQAEKDFMEAYSTPEASTSTSPPVSTRLSSLPLSKQWDEIVDFSFSHRNPITNWATIRAAAETEEVDSLERARRAFVYRKARVVYPDWLFSQEVSGTESKKDWDEIVAERLEAVQNYGEVLFTSEAVQQEWQATLAALKKDGKSLDKFAEENEYATERTEQGTGRNSGPVAKPASSNFGVDKGNLLRKAPDVESMNNAEFASYLETIKRLQPAYRRHLSDAFNSMRERRHRQLTGLPSDDPSTPLAGRTHAAYGLLKAEGLSPKDEALKFLETTFADKPDRLNQGTITSLRHPTAGLQYSLPTKTEVNRLSKTVPGLNLGARFVDGVPGAESSKQSLGTLGGLVVGDSQTGYGQSRHESVDLGLGLDGNWRDKHLEPRVDDKGKYEFRISSASINEPPAVVNPDGKRSSLLDSRTINKGPWFKESTAPPIRSNARIVSKMVHPPYAGGESAATLATRSGRRISALEANEKRSLRIGSPEWVAQAPRLTFGGVGGARFGGAGGGGAGRQPGALPDFSKFRRNVADGGQRKPSLGMQRTRRELVQNSFGGGNQRRVE